MTQDNYSVATDKLDQATASRLAKLGSMPVDTSRLDRLIQQQIPRRADEPVLRITSWIRPFRAAAAILLVFGIVGAVLYSLAGGPAVASPTDMARFHDDLVAGRVSVTHVDSINQANKMLALQWSGSPLLPNVPADQVMACCMRSVKDKKCACVLLHDADGPVTLTVAKASDVQTPTSPVVSRGGVDFHVSTVGALNMVMTEQNDKWVCIMGKMPSDRLIELASKLQF